MKVVTRMKIPKSNYWLKKDYWEKDTKKLTGKKCTYFHIDGNKEGIKVVVIDIGKVRVVITPYNSARLGIGYMSLDKKRKWADID